MNIEQQLTADVRAAIKALYGQEVPDNLLQLQKTKREFEGHLTLVTFPLLRISRKKPEETAQEIGQYLQENSDAVAAFNVVKGFLNLVVAPQKWVELLEVIDADDHYGFVKPTEASPLVMIEYSSPNTNKPLHLGHVRNNLLGWSLSQIMEANGNRVVKTNIVNDRGIHICKSMLAWLKYGNGETPQSSGKKGDHLIGDYYVAFDKHYREQVKELKAKFIAEGIAEEEAETRAKNEAPLIVEAHEMLVKWEQGDKEVRDLWRKMNAWVYEGFDETYKALGVGFDKIYYESDTYLEGKEKVDEEGYLLSPPRWFCLGRPHEGGSRRKTPSPRRRNERLYDAGHRYGQAPFPGLSHRQDDLCGWQRAELPLPGALHPAGQTRI